MSWETDYDREKEVDMKKYKDEVWAEFVKEDLNIEFKDYLLNRMYWEGLPPKEPRI
jgi:hypothetical protein